MTNPTCEVALDQDERSHRRRGVWLTPKVRVCVSLLAMILFGSFLSDHWSQHIELSARHLRPSLHHWLGTDWLGRDMLCRVLGGLRTSLGLGLLSAVGSSVLGVTLGLWAGYRGGFIDSVISWAIQLIMSLPHLVFQILIAFALGGGVYGVIAAIAFTHWASLARVVRAEALRLRTMEYVLLSQKLGRTKLWVVWRHLTPHVVPQFAVGVLLMFPHAISHEAALSFLGLGLPPHIPSTGVVLAESLRHLSTGYWWLAVFPGLGLLTVVKVFDILAEHARARLTPRMRQEVG